MQVLQCDLTLLENTFFSSREIGNFYQTEPVIGNYALCYALGLAAAPYFNAGAIHYAEHLAALNAAGVYVTPAAITGSPRFAIQMFNAQPDSYWFAMGNNALIVKPDGWDVELGSASYLVNRANPTRRRKVSTSNRPQVGTIKMLGIGNRAQFYVLAEGAPPQLPRYLRLGKWMSKARLEVKSVAFRPVSGEKRQVKALLNPVDLPAGSQVYTFDLLNIHPAPLMRNIIMGGDFLELADKEHTLLPANMRFGVEAMTDAR